MKRFQAYIDVQLVVEVNGDGSHPVTRLDGGKIEEVYLKSGGPGELTPEAEEVVHSEVARVLGL